MRLIFAGGGSGGPVTPMLAVAEQIKKIQPNAEITFVGTKAGPERELVLAEGFAFESIPAAKLRRYFSLKNIVDVFVFAAGLFKAYQLVRRLKPDVIFSVGGFVAVPLCWVGKLMKIKIVIHQQDARPGLANKLVSPMADVVTTALEETAKRFFTHAGFLKGESPKKIEWVGNPVRKDFFDDSIPHKNFFKLHDNLPVLLVTGGGTGAKQINNVVEAALPNLVKAHQIVHITGRGKNSIKFSHPDYHAYEFLGPEMPTILKMADMVICRAGLSTISELAILGKISILVPMPNSHQEENGILLKKRGAAVVLIKDEFTPENLILVVNSLKFNVKRRESLKKNISLLMPKDAAEKLAQIIIKAYGIK